MYVPPNGPGDANPARHPAKDKHRIGEAGSEETQNHKPGQAVPLHTEQGATQDRKNKQNDMRPFTLEEYKSDPSQKVVDKYGKDVRVICTDRKSERFPLIVLIDNPRMDLEDYYALTENGELDKGGEQMLFFAPAKKTAYINLYRDYNGQIVSTAYEDKLSSVAERLSHSAGTMLELVATCETEWEE